VAAACFFSFGVSAFSKAFASLAQLPQDRKKIEEFENSLGDWAGSI
jgi:hypothetical protein